MAVVRQTIEPKAKWTTYEDYNNWLGYSKISFSLVAANKKGRVVKKEALKRRPLLAYFAKLDPCLIAMKACGGANYWARELPALGHQVKLIAPHYVNPFVKGNKSDSPDAEAIAEAGQRPNMRFVPIKSVEQQDIQHFHRQRELIKKERAVLVNQIRGLLAEYGLVINKGLQAVRKDSPRVPPMLLPVEVKTLSMVVIFQRG